MSTDASPFAPDAPCPCGSGNRYAGCCERFHIGEVLPPTAEALMRSRYSAYTLALSDYLRATWAQSTRPAVLEIRNGGIAWIGLEIIKVRDGAVDDREGEVEFIARGIAGDHLNVLHETSRFIREDGAWRYLDGDLLSTPPAKIGRNAPCPCGSGLKFKRCHGR